MLRGLVVHKVPEVVGGLQWELLPLWLLTILILAAVVQSWDSIR